MQISTRPLLLIGFIVIAFTLAAYFLLDIEMTAIHTRALAFLLLSEIALFGVPIGLQFSGANHSRAFLTAGLTTASSLYFVGTLMLAFWARRFGENVNLFTLIELGLLALFAITATALLAFSRGIAQQNEADAAKISSTVAKRGGF